SYASWNYETPVALARHRIGLTDSLTAGGHIEMGRGVVNAGPSANVRLPFGEIEGAAAVSRVGTRLGQAALGSYMYSGRVISGGGSIRVMSPQYATVSLTPTSTHSSMETSFFAGVPVKERVSLSLQHSQSLTAGAASRIRTGLQASTRFHSAADLVVNASHVRDERGRGNEASVALTFRFGRRTTATISGSSDSQGMRSGVDVQQSLPTTTGFGYQ